MAVRFGLAIENFTPAPDSPSFDRIADYATRAEALGFDSLWAWDHFCLGSRQPFPILESLSALTALAVKTTRVTLGTGVLVLPLRNPVVLAKVTSTVDIISGGRLVLGLAAGWYEREFDACGVPLPRRGELFERNLEILNRLWQDNEVTADYGGMNLRRVVMLPKPATRPRPPVLIGGYVDRVLRRVATKSDGWLTYFYRPESFASSWAKIKTFAAEAGRDPAELTNVAQLPICVASSYEEADRKARDFVQAYFDVAEWSQSTPESAVRGRPDQCAEQLAAHLDAGVQHVVLVPYRYELEQVDAIATEVIPRLVAKEATTR